MKKLNISESRKNYIKSNYGKIKKSELTKEEKIYYTLVENGKKSAKNNVRFEGKYLSGEIIDIAKKVAKNKGLSLDTYLHSHKDQVIKFIDSGYIVTSKQIDNSIDILHNSKRKTVLVDTGNGIVRMNKRQAIEKLALFEQHVKSNSNVVMLATKVRKYKNGKLQVSIPEDFEDYTDSDLVDYLNEFDAIDYVESIKAE